MIIRDCGRICGLPSVPRFEKISLRTGTTRNQRDQEISKLVSLKCLLQAEMSRKKLSKSSLPSNIRGQSKVQRPHQRRPMPTPIPIARQELRELLESYELLEGRRQTPMRSQSQQPQPKNVPQLQEYPKLLEMHE